MQLEVKQIMIVTAYVDLNFVNLPAIGVSMEITSENGPCATVTAETEQLYKYAGCT